MIPGLILSGLFSVKIKENSAHILVSFFAGFGLLIIEYILLMCMGLVKGIAFLNPSFVLVYLVADRKNLMQQLSSKKRLLFASDADRVSRADKYISAGIFIALFIFFTSLAYMKTGATFVMRDGIISGTHPDTLYAVAMTGELASHFPMQHFIWAGEPFAYHCFQQAFFACFEIISGVAAFDIYAATLFVFSGFVAALSITALVDSFAGSRWQNKLLLTVIAIAGGYSCRLFIKNGDMTSGIPSFFFFNSNGEGTAFAAVTACLLLVLFSLKNSSKKQLLMLFIVSFAAAGIKSSIMLVFVCAIAGVFIVKSIGERKIDYRLLACASAVVLAFALVFLFVSDGLSNAGTKEGLSISLKTTYAISGVCSWMKNMGVSGSLHYAAYPILILAVGGPLSVLAIIEFFKKLYILIKEKRVDDVAGYIAIAMALIGSLGYVFTFQRSFSNLQFTLPVVIGLVVITGRCLAKPKVLLGAKLIIAISLVFGLVLFTNEIKATTSDFAKRQQADFTQEKYNRVTKGQIEGLRWIADNTDKDSVIAIDTFFISESDDPTSVAARNYYYNALMERRAFIAGPFYSLPADDVVRERFAANLELYSDAGSNLNEKLRKNGINYIIDSKWDSIGFNPEGADAALVFDNDEMIIYEVTDYDGEVR